MKNVFLGFLVFIALQVPVHAADKIRIGFPEFDSSTFTLPMAQIKGFFNGSTMKMPTFATKDCARLSTRPRKP